MSEILNKVRTVDLNNSDQVKEVLTSFFNKIVNHTEVNCGKWLGALEDVLSRLPRYCSTHKATIETYLTNFLNCTNYYHVIQAAKCANALQQVPWPQDKTATAKSAWRDQMVLLCDSAHSLIDALFIDNVSRRGKKKNHSQKNANSPLTTALCQISCTASTEATKKQAVLQTRLKNIFIFIQAMIVEIYPVPKPIQPQIILNIIVCSLGVTIGKKSQSSDVAPLKIQALRTLDAMIACLGPNLIPFSPLVFRIVMQMLRWTSDNHSDVSRFIRQNAYNSLCHWLTTLHSHRLPAGNAWEDELTNHIIADITPIKKIVQLTMSGGQPLKNLSKKARRKLQNRMLQESTIAAHIPGEKNKLAEMEDIKNEIALTALECAETFLSVCGVFLKPTTHKVFQEHLVSECFNSSAYSDEFLLALLRTLEASRKTTPSTAPPPTQYCLDLYSSLSNNQCREIARFCTQALLDIRMHLHCSPPSLNFALEVPKERNVIEKSSEISERNREALKKYLGDRMPDQESESEIITIHDEPTKKKPRLDPDNISVSSESVCSVEISDNPINSKVSKEVETETVVNEETNSKDINNDDEEEMDTEDAALPEIDNEIREEIQKVVNKNNLEEVGNTEAQKTSIYEAKTQLDLNTSNDDVDGNDQTLHMEVAYDLPATNDTKVRVLDQMDDDNLPSTNDTDDIQITCGQVVLPSQENEIDKTKESDEIVLDKNQKEDKVVVEESEVSPEAIPGDSKINNVTVTPDDAVVTDEAVITVDTEISDDALLTDNKVINGDKKTNGTMTETKTQDPEIITDKLSKPDGISVEDMMADFVDEVNEQTAET